MRISFSCLCLTLVFAACSSPPTQSQSPRSGLLTIETLLDIKHPSTATWSPDGQRVAFVWERAGVQNLWIAEPRDGAPLMPRAAISESTNRIESVFWGRDGASLFFVRGGDLWRLSPGGDAAAVWTTNDTESDIALSPDGTQVAFVRGGTLEIPPSQRERGDLWVRTLADGRETQLTSSPGLVVSAPGWSPDGERIAFTMVATKRLEDTPAYAGVKVLFTSLERGFSDVGVVSVRGGKMTLVAPSNDAESGPRWLDRTRLVVERVADRFKRRQILVADATSGAARVVHEDVDQKWWSVPGGAGAAPIPSADGRWIAFVSDRDGWDHVYLVSTAGGPVSQLTRGDFEAWRPVWSPDGTRLAFDVNEEPGRPGSRHLAVVSIAADGSSAPMAVITKGAGTDVSAQWAPDGRKILYQHTDAQSSADFYVIEAADPGRVTRVTDSMPATVDRTAMVAPELVSYAAPDGEKVPAYLFVPPNIDRSRKHPAVVWIHGDGTNQNYDGWHVQRNYAVYYSFHQYLLQKGYIVIAPDYRGSIGYGKRWRQGVYLDVGGKDADDAAAAATYLKTLDFVDPEKIGVWGLSYGGFFTLEAMTRTPTLFRCGVDVAGTVDYRMYFDDPYRNGWTIGRMGTPAENPATYDIAAPIDRVDQIVRPLLVLHGTSDVNVPYLHSIRLVDRLLKSGKQVEFMTYPGEFHYFQREHVLRDAWQRVDEFFDRHLRGIGARPGQEGSRETNN